ncbi:hypothetical protein DFJ74DRAFT_683414 [Hyaloraphidium curvatum]|nr:hypothetical protein DFJ74DRAFT_683414 [Hyaloraphidium curvatum]
MEFLDAVAAPGNSSCCAQDAQPAQKLVADAVPASKDCDGGHSGAADPAEQARDPKSAQAGHPLFHPAAVTTSESKYAVHPRIAEFYCTVTSPLFALPVLLYLEGHRGLNPSLHLAVALSVATGTVSALYHATLWRLWSTLDVCMASLMLYVKTIYLLSLPPSPFRPLLSHPLVPLAASLLVAQAYLRSWRSTHSLAVQLTALALPFYLAACVRVGSWRPAVAGAVGAVCFVADRKGWGRWHPAWHLFGGIFLWMGLREGRDYETALLGR